MTGQALDSETIVKTLKAAGLLLDAQLPASRMAFRSHTTDTRKADDGDLLICYRGVSFDAHDMLPKLLADKKQLALIVESKAAFEAAKTQSPFVLLVKDGREAWSYVAALKEGNPQDNLKMIAVTGTNGKTSTVWFVRQLLKAQNLPCMTLGTLGIFCGDEMLPGTHTTPDPDELFRSLRLAVDRGLQWSAMEVSSHAIAQRRLGPIRFDAVAFTSFSRDHLDFHSSMDEYFAAKWELISRYRKPHAKAWLSTSLGERLPANREGLHFYGGEGTGSLAADDFVFRVKHMDLSGTDVTLQHGPESWSGHLYFGGDFVIDNFTAAAALLHGLGCSLPTNWDAIQAVPGRFEPLRDGFAHNLAVVVDYAHTPDALEKTLKKLREMTSGKLWVVFGCGGDRDRGKRPVMGRIAEELADCPVVTSDNPRTEDPASILLEVVEGMQNKARVITLLDRRDAIQHAIFHAVAGDSILIAGKGHEDYQIIGKQKFPFDDRIVAAEILHNRIR